MLFEYEIKNDKKACNYFLFCGGYKKLKRKRKRNSAKIRTSRAVIDGRKGGRGGG